VRARLGTDNSRRLRVTRIRWVETLVGRDVLGWAAVAAKQAEKLTDH